MSIAEKRTQIYLPLEEFQKIHHLSRIRGTSVAGIIREAIRSYLEEEEMELDYENDPLNKSIGIFEADADLSASHDRYLYSEEGEQ